ncbi:MAG: hypothetical protein ACI9P9_000660 [Patescibacteria group bacterium]|jgi:hypothetical protein
MIAAFASYMSIGDSFSDSIATLVILLLAVVSYSSRPSNRRLRLEAKDRLF